MALRKDLPTLASRPLENWMILLVVARNWDAPVHGLTLSLHKLIRRVFSRSGNMSSGSWWDLVTSSILKKIEQRDRRARHFNLQPSDEIRGWHALRSFAFSVATCSFDDMIRIHTISSHLNRSTRLRSDERWCRRSYRDIITVHTKRTVILF